MSSPCHIDISGEVNLEVGMKRIPVYEIEKFGTRFAGGSFRFERGLQNEKDSNSLGFVDYDSR